MYNIYHQMYSDSDYKAGKIGNYNRRYLFGSILGFSIDASSRIHGNIQNGGLAIFVIENRRVREIWSLNSAIEQRIPLPWDFLRALYRNSDAGWLLQLPHHEVSRLMSKICSKDTIQLYDSEKELFLKRCLAEEYVNSLSDNSRQEFDRIFNILKDEIAENFELNKLSDILTLGIGG